MDILRRKARLLLQVLGASLLLAACGTIDLELETPPASVEITEQSEPGGTQAPGAIVDMAAFQDELLDALNNRDATKLQAWMTDPFVNGIWRSDRSVISAAEAVDELFNNQLQAESQLSVVKDVDLKALMGIEDPLAILGDQVIITDAYLVSGWGKDRRDEAILFVAPQPDGSLRFHAWMLVQGGFSGARLGGVQPFNNIAHGYSLFLPKGYEITTQPDNNMVFIAPGEGPDRGIAFITREPANGRSVEQVYEDIKADLGGGYNLNSTTLWIDYYQALVVTGLPGQDSNRQIFIVRDDLLYHLTFMPDDPHAGEAYQQMENLFAMIVNTFNFIQ